MTEFDPNFDRQERAISYVVSKVIDECRENAGLHDSLEGIKFKIGDVEWGVLYVEDRDFKNERVLVYRDPIELNRPMYYTLYAETGNAVRNEEITKKDNGQAKVDHKGEMLVDDPAELELIQAIVTTAHNIKRPIR